MPIQAQTIINRMRRVGLDAEGSDYYTDTEDLIPAINASLQWLVSVINLGFASNKLSEETFRELVKVGIFQANDYSRIMIDPTFIGHDVWTILGVYPKPTTNQAAAVVACTGTNVFTDGDNGTMETDISGLNTSTASGDALVKSSDQAFQGSFSAKYTSGTTQATTSGRKLIGTDAGISITKGLSYEMKAQVYVPSGQTLDLFAVILEVRMNIDTTTGAVSSLTQITTWKASANPFGAWFEISAKFTALISTTVFPEVFQSIFSTSVGIIYVDKIEVNCVSDPEDSFFLDNLSFLSSEYSAKRLTAEEWNENRGNPFSAGNTIQTPATCPEIASYAYKNFTDYTSLTYNIPVSREIEIRPAIADELVAIEYLKVPTEVVLVTDSIEFPAAFENLIYEKALNFVSFKQGDNTTINSVTNEDLNLLIKTIL